MSDNNRSSGCTINLGVGSAIAAVLSYALNNSFWWMVFHFFCGGFYVLYAAIFREKEIIPALQKMFGG